MGKKDVVWILTRWLGIGLAVRALGFWCELHPAEIDEALWLRWVRALAWHPIAGSLGWTLIAWALRGPLHPREHPRPDPGEDSPPSPSHPLFQ